MIECKYKYTLEDNLKGTKFAISNKKSKKDKIMLGAIITAFVLLIALFIYDIATSQSIVMDIILLVAFTILFLFEIFMPKYVLSSQKKFFETSGLKDVDFCVLQFDENKVCEMFVQGEQIAGKNDYDYKNLTRLEEDEERLYLLFGKVFMVVVKKEGMSKEDFETVKTSLYSALEENIKLKKQGKKYSKN